MNDPTDKELREAQRVLEQLIGINAVEAEFQQFFAQHPYVFSRSLPLRLSPTDFQPLGRPGRTEPDFVFYPKMHHNFPLYGVIELKRPGTSIAHVRRKNVLQLSSDAQTAILQAKAYLGSEQPIVRPDQVLVLGNRAVAFIILGLSETIIQTMAQEFFWKQLNEQMPANIHLIPYDVLLRQFSSTVPRSIFLLVPRDVEEISIVPGQMKWSWKLETDSSMAGEDWHELSLEFSFSFQSDGPKSRPPSNDIVLAQADLSIPGFADIHSSEWSRKIGQGENARLDVTWFVFSDYSDWGGSAYRRLLNSPRDVTVMFHDSRGRTYTTRCTVPSIPATR